jgi:hypothetical protein
MKQALKQFVSDVYLTDLRFRICYFVPHFDQNLEEATVFQGATKGLVATAALLEWTMIQPADIRELTASWNNIAFFRTAGLITHRVLPIEHSAFREVVRWPSGPPFRCVVTADESADFVDSCIADRRDLWLHVSTKPGAGRKNLEDVNWRTILDHVRGRLKDLEGDANNDFLVKAARSFLTTSPPSGRRLSLPRTGHNLTRANEIALQAFGCKLSEGRQSPGTEDGQRRPFAVNALLLTVPAVFRAYKTQKYMEEFHRVLDTSSYVGRVLRAVLNPTTYLFHTNEEDLERILKDEVCSAIFGMRQEELALYTTTLIRVAAGSLVPTLRINPQANRSWGLLKGLAECARRNGPHAKWKQARLLNKAQECLEGGLQNGFAERLEVLGD